MTTRLHLQFAIGRLEARRQEYIAQLSRITLDLEEVQYELEKLKLMRRHLRMEGRPDRHMEKK